MGRSARVTSIDFKGLYLALAMFRTTGRKLPQARPVLLDIISALLIRLAELSHVSFPGHCLLPGNDAALRAIVETLDDGFRRSISDVQERLASAPAAKLQKTVEALLGRLPTAGGLSVRIRTKLSFVALMEWSSDKIFAELSGRERATIVRMAVKQTEQAIEEIAVGTLGGKYPHIHETIAFQRALLIRYLAGYPFPFRHHNNHASLWLAEHAETIKRGSTVFSCFCTYAKIADVDREKLAACHGNGAVADLLLATLHQIEPFNPAYIRKADSRFRQSRS